jgi:hypothetical protein
MSACLLRAESRHASIGVLRDIDDIVTIFPTANSRAISGLSPSGIGQMRDCLKLRKILGE